MGKSLFWINSCHKRYTPPVNQLAIAPTNYHLTDDTANTHNLTGVPAGALLVVLTGNQNSTQNATVTSSPSLTWTKRSDATTPNSEIWTAVFTAGGSIDVTSDWGVATQSSSVFVVTGQEDTLEGASASANSQNLPSVAITTTRANSIIFVNSTNWNSVDGARTYIGTGTEQYAGLDVNSNFYHYTYTALTAQLYTVGMTAPNDVDGGYGTSVLEIRGSGLTIADTTPPTAPVLSSPTHGTTTVNLSWTASTDNVSVSGYEVYQDGVIIATTSSLSYNATGLTASTLYDFLVRAKDPAGNGTNSNTVSVTTNAGGGGGGQDDYVDFSFTAYGDVDYIRYMAGNYRWQEKSGSQIVAGAPTPGVDYRRWTWTDLEQVTQNNYVWTEFDAFVNNAINNGRTWAFGIMTSFPYGDGVFNAMENYSGTDERTDTFFSNRDSAYPEYLHDLMQAETDTDWIDASGNWCMNANSTNYLGRLRALHAAIWTHIQATSHVASGGPHDGETINYADALEFIDVRGMGSWGELHSGANVPGWPQEASTWYPANTFPTAATWEEIIDLHTEEFPDVPLMIIFNILDGERFVNTQIPNSAGVYALNASNNWGPLGLRNDHIGEYQSYNDSIMKDNTNVYDAGTDPDTLMNEIIQERWKTAPLMGEPPGPGYHDTGGCGFDLCDFVNEQVNYHYSFVGNGNFENDNPSALSEAMWLEEWSKMGYIIGFTGGYMDLNVNDLSIKLDWTNTGNAPTYNNWDVTFELRTGGGSVVWSAVSQFNPFRVLLPDEPDTEILDIYDRPGIADGTYGLFIICKDPIGNYRQPLFLHITTTRESDGSYKLCDVIFATV